MCVGNVLAVLVVFGSLAPQAIGAPTTTHNAYHFMGMFGWPRTFLVCDGIQRGPLPGELPRDATHTDWLTRVLVPVNWQPHRYPPRTPPLLILNWRPFAFDGRALMLNGAYAITAIVGARMSAASAHPGRTGLAARALQVPDRGSGRRPCVSPRPQAGARPRPAAGGRSWGMRRGGQSPPYT